MVCRRRVSRFNDKNLQKCVNKPTCKLVYSKKKKIKMLLAGLGSVRKGKNCDLVGISQPAKNILTYILHGGEKI